MRLNHFLPLCLSVVFASCNPNQETNSEISTPTSVEKKQEKDSVLGDTASRATSVTPDTEKVNTFLSLFKPLNPQGYHAYSPEFNGSMEVTTPQLKGVAIDAKAYADLFQEKLFPMKGNLLNGYGGIFVLGQFTIDERYKGLVVRQHSQYSDTQIALMVWDNQKKEIVHVHELADMFGDAGWYFDTESWITEYKPNEKLEIVTRTKDYEPKEDFSSGTVTDSLKISRFAGGKFVTENAPSLDKSKFQLKRWKEVK